MVAIPVGELRVQARTTPGQDWLADLLACVPEAGSSLMAAQQQRARQALAGQSLPSRRQEAWRFTEVAALAAIPAQPLTPREDQPSATALPAPQTAVLRLVLDGRTDPLAGVSLPAGLERLDAGALEPLLGQALSANGSEACWPVLLNGAVASQVLALRVSQAVPTVLELLCDTAGAAGVLGLRLLLVLEAGASLELLEVHRAGGASLTSVVLEAQLGRGARLRHGLLAQGAAQQAGDDGEFRSGAVAPVLLHHLAAVQDPDSELELIAAVAGWGLARLEPLVLQRSGAASTRLRGLQRVDGSQVVDTHSRVLFAGPDGRLDQVHKALADGAGRSVFNGAVIVPRQAQRTDASQLSRSLLLSDRARIDTKPELEIVADDVKCAHGATVSRLQQDELFYLQSRGIAAAQAQRLLLRGFCEEVLADLPAPASSWQPLAQLMGEDPAP